MAGLTVVAEMIGAIGASARTATVDIKKATAAAKTYKETTGRQTTSAMSKAAGSGTSGMGAADGSPVDTNALSAALQITRGRL